MFPVSLEEEQDIEDEVRKLNRMLHEKGIRILVLRRTDRNVLLYVYRPDYLDRDLGVTLAAIVQDGRYENIVDGTSVEVTRGRICTDGRAVILRTQ